MYPPRKFLKKRILSFDCQLVFILFVISGKFPCFLPFSSQPITDVTVWSLTIDTDSYGIYNVCGPFIKIITRLDWLDHEIFGFEVQWKIW